MSVLEVAELTRHFGGLPALDALSLSVGSGDILGLVGPNGAGKTTALACIAGLLAPTSCQRLELDGQDLRRLRPDERNARGIAMVRQRPQVFGSLTVIDDVTVGALRAGGRRAQARAHAHSVLRMLTDHGAPDVAPDRQVGSLNTHQRRIVALARGLAGDPRVLLLDEPMAGLSPAEVADQVRLIGSLVASHHLAVVLVEHVLSAVADLAGHVVVLDHGVVIATGGPAEVFDDSQVRRAYLGVDSPPDAARNPA